MHYYHHRITTIYAVLLFVTVFAFGGQKDDRRKKTAISYKNIICVQAGISNRAGQTVRIMMRLLMIMTSRRRRGRRRLLHWRICPEAATLTLKEFYRVQCEGRPGMRPWNHDKALPAWPAMCCWLAAWWGECGTKLQSILLLLLWWPLSLLLGIQFLGLKWLAIPS